MADKNEQNQQNQPNPSGVPLIVRPMTFRQKAEFFGLAAGSTALGMTIERLAEAGIGAIGRAFGEKAVETAVETAVEEGVRVTAAAAIGRGFKFKI